MELLKSIFLAHMSVMKKLHMIPSTQSQSAALATTAVIEYRVYSLKGRQNYNDFDLL